MSKQKNVVSLWQQVVPIPKICQKQSLHSTRVKFGKIPPAVVEKFKRPTPREVTRITQILCKYLKTLQKHVVQNPTTLNLQNLIFINLHFHH